MISGLKALLSAQRYMALIRKGVRRPTKEKVKTTTELFPRERWQTPYIAQTTHDDIFYCFRLLLGRNPSPEEIAGHMSRVGEDLTSVVASYLTSLEFARRGLLRQVHSDVAMTDLVGFKIYSSDDDISVGKVVRTGNYESHVTAFFRKFLKPAMRVVDIGANIGYFTMLSASIVGPQGYVLAVEPNPHNVKLLEASRRANGFDWVSVVQVAAGRVPGVLALHTSHSNGMTSALDSNMDALLDCETVPSIPLDSICKGPIDLIKIDVEGAEYNALLGSVGIIRQCLPTIVSEFSPGMLLGISNIDGPGYLQWVLDLGYRLAIIEDDGSITDAGSDWQRVMTAYERHGSDHIDIIAAPLTTPK
jgi:FkbM family methyltransferase